MSPQKRRSRPAQVQSITLTKGVTFDAFSPIQQMPGSTIQAPGPHRTMQ